MCKDLIGKYFFLQIMSEFLHFYKIFQDTFFSFSLIALSLCGIKQYTLINKNTKKIGQVEKNLPLKLLISQNPFKLMIG